MGVENQKWYVQLDCSEDRNMISSPPSCGRNIETPCCNLQEVLNSIVQDGDTVYLRQMAAGGQPWCNESKEINIAVTKPVILQTQQPDKTENRNSIEVIDGIKFTFYNNGSDHCTITVKNSKFSCSFLKFCDLDIKIENKHPVQGQLHCSWGKVRK